MLAEKKITILTWAVIVLAIMTLSIIATIVFKANFAQGDWHRKADRFGVHWRGRAFVDNMNFSESQLTEFHRLDYIFANEVSEITAELDRKREALFAELERPETDTAKCQEIATEIGMLHRDLKIKTYRFYLGVKRLCNGEQKEKLKEVFAPVFNMEEGRRHGNGRLGGHYGWHH